MLTDEAERTLQRIKRDARKEHERTSEILHNKGLAATQVLKKNVAVQERNKRHRHELSIR